MQTLSPASNLGARVVGPAGKDFKHSHTSINALGAGRGPGIHIGVLPGIKARTRLVILLKPSVKRPMAPVVQEFGSRIRDLGNTEKVGVGVSGWVSGFMIIFFSPGDRSVDSTVQSTT